MASFALQDYLRRIQQQAQQVHLIVLPGLLGVLVHTPLRCACAASVTKWAWSLQYAVVGTEQMHSHPTAAELKEQYSNWPSSHMSQQ